MSHVGSGKGVGFGIDAALLSDLASRELFQAATQTRQKTIIEMYLLKVFMNFIWGKPPGTESIDRKPYNTDPAFSQVFFLDASHCIGRMM